MKKTIKISQKGLRSLIKEAIQSREPGSLLFTPPAEKRQKVSESVADDSDLDAYLDACADGWHSMSAEDDPSIQATGQAEWEMQVESAVTELKAKIAQATDEVEQKLINGEFYQGGF